MRDRSESSVARQALSRIAEKFPQRIKEAMGVRGEILVGSFSKTHKICGNPNCKCARGEKHEVYQLSWTEGGKRRCIHVKRNEITAVRAAVQRYRKLRRCRAELLKLASEAAAQIDKLVEALGVSHPGKDRGRHR